MIYFWGLLKAEFVKSIKLTFRYKFNTLFNILFWAVLMVLLSLSSSGGNRRSRHGRLSARS